MAEQAEKNFKIQKIYLKDVSLESPQSPAVFNANAEQEGSPKVDVRFNIGQQQLSEEVNEITLTLTVEASRDENNVYLVEVMQAGIFTMSGFEPQELHHITGAYAPEILFPYAREAVDSLLVKAGFPPLAIGPVNFEQHYRQNLQRQIEAAKAAQEANEGEADETTTSTNDESHTLN